MYSNRLPFHLKCFATLPSENLRFELPPNLASSTVNCLRLEQIKRMKFGEFEPNIKIISRFAKGNVNRLNIFYVTCSVLQH